MVSSASPLFLAVLTCLLVHELDAVRRREWRFFFARVPVSEETAYRLFTAIHAPAFVLVLWALDAPTFQVGVDAFAVVHAALHLLFRSHPAVEFDSWFSRVWIYGGALLGAGHLLSML